MATANPRGRKSTGFTPLDIGAIKNALRVCALIEKSRKRGVTAKMRREATYAADGLDALLKSGWQSLVK
jgi:hypothetical protein